MWAKLHMVEIFSRSSHGGLTLTNALLNTPLQIDVNKRSNKNKNVKNVKKRDKNKKNVCKR